jgi:3-isopropylmalate/(R)-2-methylmalate dehydratase large subunit
MEEGLLAIFMEAGAVIGPPTCGPCLGGHMGILAPGETAIATTTQLVGAWDTQSKIYLANPVTASASPAASAAGRFIRQAFTKNLQYQSQ